MSSQEILLSEDEKRFVIFPIKQDAFGICIKKHRQTSDSRRIRPN